MSASAAAVSAPSSGVLSRVTGAGRFVARAASMIGGALPRSRRNDGLTELYHLASQAETVSPSLASELRALAARSGRDD